MPAFFIEFRGVHEQDVFFGVFKKTGAQIARFARFIGDNAVFVERVAREKEQVRVKVFYHRKRFLTVARKIRKIYVSAETNGFNVQFRKRDCCFQPVCAYDYVAEFVKVGQKMKRRA